jgi:hypothetical protein
MVLPAKLHRKRAVLRDPPRLPAPLEALRRPRARAWPAVHAATTVGYRGAGTRSSLPCLGAALPGLSVTFGDPQLEEALEGRYRFTRTPDLPTIGTVSTKDRQASTAPDGLQDNAAPHHIVEASFDGDIAHRRLAMIATPTSGIRTPK